MSESPTPTKDQVDAEIRAYLTRFLVTDEASVIRLRDLTDRFNSDAGLTVRTRDVFAQYSLHAVRPTTTDLSWSRISHRLVNELRCLWCFQQGHLKGYLLQEFLLLILWVKANVEMVCFFYSSLILVLYEPVSNWLTFRYLSMLPRRFERKKNDLKIILKNCK